MQWKQLQGLTTSIFVRNQMGPSRDFPTLMRFKEAVEGAVFVETPLQMSMGYRHCTRFFREKAEDIFQIIPFWKISSLITTRFL